MENAFAGHLHHAAGEGHPGQDAKTGDKHDGSPGRYPGTHCRVEKIDRIVADADHKIHDGYSKQNPHRKYIDIHRTSQFGFLENYQAIVLQKAGQA